LDGLDPRLVLPNFRILSWEPTQAYRHFARMFRAFLSLQSELQAGELGAADDWAFLYTADAANNFEEGPAEHSNWRNGRPIRSADTRPTTVAEAAAILHATIDELMGYSPVELALASGPDHDRTPRITLQGNTFGILMYQLAIAVQGGLFAICSHCHRTYAPTRKPQRGRDNYCLGCREARKTVYKRKQREIARESRS
jgi:hypothetical protein